MIRQIFLVCLAPTLVGCATDYKPRSFRGGYSETRIDENVFIIWLLAQPME